MTDDAPEAGLVSRGVFQPLRWSIPIRLVARCVRCDRRVTLWRTAGTSGSKPQCNGSSKPSCGEFRAAREAAHQMVGTMARRAAKDAVKAERARLLGIARGIDTAPPAYLAASSRRDCPRPDKKAWATGEVAKTALVTMLAKQRPNAEHLRVYLCACGWHHIGNAAVRSASQSNKSA